MPMSRLLAKKRAMFSKGGNGPLFLCSLPRRTHLWLLSPYREKKGYGTEGFLSHLVAQLLRRATAARRRQTARDAVVMLAMLSHQDRVEAAAPLVRVSYSNHAD